jgi:hypothetical protein
VPCVKCFTLAYQDNAEAEPGRSAGWQAVGSLHREGPGRVEQAAASGWPWAPVWTNDAVGGQPVGLRERLVEFVLRNGTELLPL